MFIFLHNASLAKLPLCMPRRYSFLILKRHILKDLEQFQINLGKRTRAQFYVPRCSLCGFLPLNKSFWGIKLTVEYPQQTHLTSSVQMLLIALIIHHLVFCRASCVANAVVIAYLQVWRGCWEEQATHYSWSEGVPAGDEEKLQQTAREPEAHAGEKDPGALQAHHQTSHRE